MTKFITLTEATITKDTTTGNITIRPYRSVAIDVNEILRVVQGPHFSTIHLRTEIQQERNIKVIESFNAIVEQLT